MEEAPHCLNCETPNVAVYCGQCGQRHIPIDHFNLKAVWEEYGERGMRELKLWPTLTTLLRHPGKLTVDYLAGKRVGQANPLLLYAFLTTTSMWLTRMRLPEVANAIVQNDPTGDQALQAAIAGIIPTTVVVTQYAAALLYPIAQIGAVYLLMSRDALKAAVFVVHVSTIEMLFQLALAAAQIAVLDRMELSVDYTGPFAGFLATAAYFALSARTAYGQSWGRIAITMAGAFAARWTAFLLMNVLLVLFYMLVVLPLALLGS